MTELPRTRCWLALVDAPPDDADAAAAAHDATGAPAGALAAWWGNRKPVPEARRVDARLVDPAGASATISLVRPPHGISLLFDDHAVQQARRRVLAGPRFDAVATLLSDASHFEGAVTVARGDAQVARLRDDPFAYIFRARILTVGPGVLGALPAPAGPTIERYGSANPWPWDRFTYD